MGRATGFAMGFAMGFARPLRSCWRGTHQRLRLVLGLFWLLLSGSGLAACSCRVKYGPQPLPVKHRPPAIAQPASDGASRPSLPLDAGGPRSP